MNPPAAAGQRPFRAAAAAEYEVENLRIENKGLYSGHMSHGVRSGRGPMVYDNKARYKGDWMLHKQHGEGVIEWTNGKRYDGNWRHGKYHGRGVYTRIDGSSFEGVWSEGKSVRQINQEPEADEMEADMEPGVKMEEAIEMEEALEMEAESDAEMEMEEALVDEEPAVEPDVEVATEEALAADAPVISPVRPVINDQEPLADYLNPNTYAITNASSEDLVVIRGGEWDVSLVKTVLTKTMPSNGSAYIYFTTERCPNSVRDCTPVFVVFYTKHRDPTLTVCNSDGANLGFDEVGFQWTNATAVNSELHGRVKILTSSVDTAGLELYFANSNDLNPECLVDNLEFTYNGQLMKYDREEHGSWTKRLKSFTNAILKKVPAADIDKVNKDFEKVANGAIKRASRDNHTKACQFFEDWDLESIDYALRNAALNSQATITPKFRDRFLRQYQWYLGPTNLRAVSTHLLQRRGLEANPAIDRRKLCSLYSVIVNWKTTKSPLVLLAVIVIGEYIIATRLRWSDAEDLSKRLVKDHGLWAILQFIGCKDIGAAILESFEALVHRASFEFVKIINGRYPNTVEEIVYGIFSESTDSEQPSTRSSTIEVEHIQLNKQNPMRLEVKYKDCEKKDSRNLRGKPHLLPPGARDDDVKCGAKRKREEMGPNCMVKCIGYLPSSVMSPSAKGRFNQEVKTHDHQMITVSTCRRVFEKCIKSACIGSKITKNVKEMAMKEMDAVMLASCAIEGSYVKHCILIDSTEARTGTRHRGNGVMIDPEKEFGVYPRNDESWRELKIQEITELYEVRKTALSDKSRTVLRKKMPLYNWWS